MDTVVESDLVAQVDEYFDNRNKRNTEKEGTVVTMVEPEPSAL